MLTMVMANPIQFMMVNPVPTNSFGAVLALIAEYCGESPTTTIPQKIKKPIKISGDAENKNGDRIQQIPDSSS